MKYSWKGHKDRNRHKNRIKGSGQARLVYVIDINHNIPTTRKWARGDRKIRVVGRIYGMKYSWKGHKDRNRHRNRIKGSGQARLVYVIDINRNTPTTWRWARGDICWSKRWRKNMLKLNSGVIVNDTRLASQKASLLLVNTATNGPFARNIHEVSVPWNRDWKRGLRM